MSTSTRNFNHQKFSFFVFMIFLCNAQSKAVDFRIDSLNAFFGLNNIVNISFMESNGLSTTGTAAGHHYDSFYFSADSTIDSSDHLIYDYYLYTTIYGVTSGYFIHTLPSVPDGNYFIIGIADSRNEIIETNEANNETVKRINIFNNRVLDLKITIGAFIDSVIPGQVIHPPITISNTGKDVTLGSPLSIVLSEDSIYGNDVLLHSYNYGPIRPNSLVAVNPNVVIPANSAPGAYYILYKLDPSELILESNETDNSAYSKVVVQQQNVDLVITALSFSRTVVLGGQGLYVNTAIANQGTTISMPSTLHYYLSKKNYYDSTSVLVSSAYLHEVSLERSYLHEHQLFIPESILAGSYKLIVVLESTQQVETNETNNTAYKSISITKATRDLSIRNLKLDKNTYRAGDLANTTFTVSNNGNSSTNGTSIDFYLSSDARYSSDDLHLGNNGMFVLSPKQSISTSNSFIIPESVGSGRFNIIAFADLNNYEQEVNENNNSAYKQIRVLSPVSTQANTFAVDEIRNTIDWKVLPNPVQESFELTSQHLTNGLYAKVTIYNIFDGTVVTSYKLKIYNNKVEVDASAIPCGAYILTVEYADYIQRLHFNKE